VVAAGVTVMAAARVVVDITEVPAKADADVAAAVVAAAADVVDPMDPRPIARTGLITSPTITASHCR
jgi:hypothetical protein